MQKTDLNDSSSPAELITGYIAGLGDWRGELLARLRALVLALDPQISEEWKWGTPVWVKNGNFLAGAAFKEHVKLNFFKGAALPDPHGLFNAGLEAKASRGIDFPQGAPIDEAALQELIRAAIALNGKK